MAAVAASANFHIFILWGWPLMQRLCNLLGTNSCKTRCRFYEVLNSSNILVRRVLVQAGAKLVLAPYAGIDSRQGSEDEDVYS